MFVSWRRCSCVRSCNRINGTKNDGKVRRFASLLVLIYLENHYCEFEGKNSLAQLRLQLADSGSSSDFLADDSASFASGSPEASQPASPLAPANITWPVPTIASQRDGGQANERRLDPRTALRRARADFGIARALSLSLPAQPARYPPGALAD